MLPALVNHLDAVTIGVEDSRCEVARAVMQARAKRTVVCGPRRHSGHAFSDKTDVRGTRVRTALPQPERHPTLAPKTRQIRMPLGAISAVIVSDMKNAERCQLARKTRWMGLGC